jgi:hypothetical protein
MQRQLSESRKWLAKAIQAIPDHELLTQQCQWRVSGGGLYNLGVKWVMGQWVRWVPWVSDPLLGA